ncbi:hypothetical protein ACHAQA_004196 [Verticillium albo-atrum]
MTESTAPAPKRWLPFKPTALRQNSNPKPEKKDGSDDDDGLSLFERSKEFFPKVIAEEEERRRKRKQSKRDKGKERATSIVDAREDDEDEHGHGDGARLSNDSHGRHSGSRSSRPRDAKRTIEDSDDDLVDHIKTPPSKRSRTSDESIDRKTKTRRSTSQDHPGTPSKHTTALALRTPKKEGTMQNEKPVISLDDSEDSEEDVYSATPVRQLGAVRSTSKDAILIDDDPFAEEEASADEAEDEFAEFIRAARERKKKAEEAKANPTEADQTHITILMTSPIPDAKPTKFLYTLWKPMGKLRDVWNQTQGHEIGLPEDDLATTFITWRGRRLYDSTTLNSLQIRAAENGTLQYPATRNHHDTEGFSDGWTKVHMEMWTEELWEEHKKKEERKRLRDLGELDDYSDEEDGGAAVDKEPEEKKIKIILKARTGEPVKTTARSMTTIAELVEVFRKVRELPESIEVQLHFDGEQLDGETTVEEADIEDMDSLEVHIKE